MVENKGPASYFPSIEKKYGHPISYWIDLVHANTELTRHGELVTWLNHDHGLCHCHSNAVVGHALQNRP